MLRISVDHAPSDRAAGVARLLGPLVPPGTAVDVRVIDDFRDSLFDVEREAVARAVPGRQREFSTGRASARAALATLGLPQRALPVGPGREPIWPAGYIGSIAHAAGLCIALARRRDHVRGIGADLEPATPLDPELRDMICTAAERRDGVPRSSAEAPDAHKVIFCAKEALYKAIYPLVQRYVDFQEVSIELDLDGGAWRPRSASRDLSGLCASTTGSLLVTDGEIVTVAWCG